MNPGNMLIGYHTDWAGNFPFLELGLRDNYAAPPAQHFDFWFRLRSRCSCTPPGYGFGKGWLWPRDQMRAEAIAGGLTVARIPGHSSEQV